MGTPLSVELSDLVDAARKAWPGVMIDEAELVRTLAEHPKADTPGAIGADAAIDAALALACGRGDKAALSAFDAIVADVVPGALAHMKLSADRVDEVAQRVRERLLVPTEDGPPRIARYAARGAIRGLVAVVAARIAIETTRSDKRERPGDEPADVPGDAVSPELALVKEEYRAAFRGAFARAVGEIDAHDRNLLRLHLASGVTLPELAKMYGVDRATIVRRLARIREAIFNTTKRTLKAELRIDEREFESLLGIVRSKMDVSVMSLLRDDATRSAT
jgi:RNA polymerase sigma-70 factor (ECF subfamily)